MIQIIEQYLDRLKNTLSKEIEKTSYFNMDLYNQFSEFERLNFFLINKSIDKTLNLFIKNVEFQDESSFYEPLFKSISLSLFLKNYVEDITSYEVGDILYKDGKTFELLEKNGKDVKLEEKSFRSKHGPTIITKNIKDLKSYFITNKLESSNRTLVAKLDDYRKFFTENFNISDNYIPSKFIHKAVIVIEKKEFTDKLKGKNILKQIPIQWVTKDGTFEKTKIPIEPMIYLVPDYETFNENIIDKEFNIETVIFVGINKYKNCFTNIQRDLREKNIKNVIIVSSEETQEIKETDIFIKWRWTYTEFAKLNNFSLPEISTTLVEENTFSESINEYEDYLKTLESEFSIDLKPLLKNMFLFSLVFSDIKDQRQKNEIEYKKNLKIKEAKLLIDDKLQSQNKDSKEYIDKVIQLINNIFSSFNNEKLKLLKRIEKNSTFVALDSLVDNFNLKDVKELKWRELYNKLSNPDYKKDKNIYFISLFGYCNPKDLIFKLLQTSHKYNFLSYSLESEIIKKIENYYFNNNHKEYYSEDRKKLTGIDFKDFEEEVKSYNDISDLIEKINLNHSNEKTNYDFGSGEQVNYKIILTFDDSDESIILDGDNFVILEKFGKKNKVKVYHLLENDNIRIYQNISKNRLFEIAVDEDKEGRFYKINQDSKLWKTAFKQYAEQPVKKDLNYILHKLKEYGSKIINISTLEKWLDFDDKNKFPRALKDLESIKNLTDDITLKEHFESIKKSRRLFRSIMISLGRGLSNEVIDYIMSNKIEKGKILSKFSEHEIDTFVKESTPLRKIKKIEITEEEENA